MYKEKIKLIKNEIAKFATLLRANKQIYRNNHRICAKHNADPTYPKILGLLIEPDWIFEIPQFEAMRQDSFRSYTDKVESKITSCQYKPTDPTYNRYYTVNYWDLYCFHSLLSYRDAVRMNVTALHILLTRLRGKGSHVNQEKAELYSELVNGWEKRLDEQLSKGVNDDSTK